MGEYYRCCIMRQTGNCKPKAENDLVLRQKAVAISHPYGRIKIQRLQLLTSLTRQVAHCKKNSSPTLLPRTRRNGKTELSKAECCAKRQKAGPMLETALTPEAA